MYCERNIKMILSDQDIKYSIDQGEIRIVPLLKDSIQPASVDLHLDGKFIIFHYGKSIYIDPKKPVDEFMKEFTGDEFVIYPGQLVLASTYEKIRLPNNIAGRVEGKSSLGRIGLMVHVTAGFIDPGNDLNITLELVNLSPVPIKLYYKMPIAQICFMETKTPVEYPYGHEKLNSKYFGDEGPQISKYNKNEI